MSSQQLQFPSCGPCKNRKGWSECLAGIVLFIHSTKPQTFQVPKPQKNPPSPGLPLQPPPFSLVMLPHPLTISKAVQHAQVLYNSPHFVSAGKTEAMPKKIHCASGIAYLQLGHVLFVADLQWLPLVFLLLQLAVAVCQLFHQTSILRSQLV